MSEGPLQPLRSTNISLHRVRKTIFFANLCGKTKCWNCALNNFLKKKNLKQSLSDLLSTSFDLNFLVAIYVDDIILGGRKGTRIVEVMEELSQNFKRRTSTN